MKKHLLTFLMLSIIVCVGTQRVSAANEPYAEWDGTTTAITPVGQVFVVNNASELAWLAALDTNYMGMTIQLNANVDLKGCFWRPIGTAEKPFCGVFHGHGHLIRGLRYLRGTDGVGLFGYVDATGSIDSLGISGGAVSAKGKRRVGVLAGVNAGAIKACWSMSKIDQAGNVVGGLVGELTATGSITDAYNAGLIYMANDTIGGVVGRNNGGVLTRVYNIGYAKNGKAIVGADNGGTYNDCFYDRKLYYQQSGITDDLSSPMDVTSSMFTLFTGHPLWAQAANRYPVLTAFAATDAALLAATPMYIESESTNPVNHANDLTLDFTVSTDGGVTWTCEDKSAEQWIAISGSDVDVTRPCTETDVLVDAKLNDEVHIVYMRPRRMDDLLAGRFNSYDIEEGIENVPLYFCYNSYEELQLDARMEQASKGWLGDGDYAYKVERHSIDDAQQDTTVIDTILFNANSATFKNWFKTYLLPTDTSGHFIIRAYVHDNGCVTDWLEMPHGVEYYVYGKFIPGEIETKRDTILLNTIPVLVSTSGSEASVGGDRNVYYQWFKNGDSIQGQTGLELIGYPIRQAGIYTFTRGTRDSICYVPEYALEDLGVYTVVAFDSIDPGEIIDHADKIFCTEADAKDYIIKATKATGGIGTLEYRWFIGNTLIDGATGVNLSLSGLNLEAGKSYIFHREVQDDTHFTTWKKTRYTLTIYVMAPLTPGAIESAELDNYCFDASAISSTTATIQINESDAAVCADGVMYKWIRTPGNDSIGNTKNLNYTFPKSDVTMGTTYTYTRWVRNSNPDCDWVKSEGEVKQYYGQSKRYEVTKTICKERMPYILVHAHPDGTTSSHTFTYDGEQWTVTDTDKACPVDSVFTIRIAEMPSFTMDTEAHVCQETGTMSLQYTQTAGMSNTFRITFSPDMAVYMGRHDTVGTITQPGLIIMDNMPPIGEGNCYLELEIGYTGGGKTDEICYSTPSRMQVTFSLGGYLHTKYDRVLFVDNNPDNGLVTGGAEKLKFVKYQWYKDGQILEGDTMQYYHQGGKQLSGTFYVVMTSEDGWEYRSCEIILPTGSSSTAPQITNVYPIPVDAGQTLNIEGGNELMIISFSGEKVTQMNNVESITSVNAPRVPGIYFVQITTEEGVIEMHKLIVK